MARCAECNQVFSDSYLKDGVCVDCSEKVNNKLNSDEIDEKNRLLKLFDVKISSEKYLEMKKEIDKLINKYKLGITIEIYIQITKIISLHINTLVSKKIDICSNENVNLEKWNKELEYFIQTTILDKLNISEKYLSLIKDITEDKIKNKYWIVTYLGIDNIDLDIDLRLLNIPISTENIQKQIEILKDKYNDKISIELYTQILKLLTIFRLFLLKKRLELVTTDSYGNTSLDKWNNFVNDFANNIIIPNLIISNDEINNKIINNIIIHEIENNSFPNISETSASMIRSLILGVALLVVILFIYGIINLFASSSSTQQGISDKEYYEMKYQQEKKQTLKDIQKAVDEYKYQQYK
ncbi:hypothetical protein ACOL3G_04455 [Aliarcobacter butzleri]